MLKKERLKVRILCGVVNRWLFPFIGYSIQRHKSMDGLIDPNSDSSSRNDSIFASPIFIRFINVRVFIFFVAV